MRFNFFDNTAERAEQARLKIELTKQTVSDISRVRGINPGNIITDFMNQKSDFRTALPQMPGLNVSSGLDQEILQHPSFRALTTEAQNELYPQLGFSRMSPKVKDFVRGRQQEAAKIAEYERVMFPGESARPSAGLFKKIPHFSSDTGSVGNLMGIPFQVGIGAVKGAYRGLRFGFDGGSYGTGQLGEVTRNIASSQAVRGLPSMPRTGSDILSNTSSVTRVAEKKISAFGATASEIHGGIGKSLGMIKDAEGRRHFMPIKAVGETLGGAAQTTTQTAGALIHTATVPAAKAIGRGAMALGRSVVANAPAIASATQTAAIQIGTGAATAGLTLGLAAYQTSKDLFNFMFTSDVVKKGDRIVKQYGLTKAASTGIIPAAIVSQAAYGALKGTIKENLGFIQAGELPNMLYGSENSVRSQRRMKVLNDLDNIEGITFALHKLR